MADKQKGKKKLTEAEKAARKEALKNESKAAKFLRLARKRMPRALKALASVANLAGYEFTDDQRDKILAAIGDAANEIRTRFMREKKAANEFQL